MQEVWRNDQPSCKPLYMEIGFDAGESSWALNSVWARAQADIRRDFINSVSKLNFGTVQFPNPEATGSSLGLLSEVTSDTVSAFNKQIDRLAGVIERLESALQDRGGENEAGFHRILEEF